MKNVSLPAILAIVVGLLFCIAAILYCALPAGSLPGFLPGHMAGSPDHHFKHGVLAFVLGLACFVAARFLAAPKDEAM